MDNNKLLFKAESRTLGAVLFESKITYRVPLYQRPYDWGNDQLSEFFEDIQNKNTFIGSIILSKAKANNEEFIEVIDGQQRLTTIQIMFCVMRDYAKEIGLTAHANSIEEQNLYFLDMFSNRKRRFISGFLTDDFIDEYLIRGEKDIKGDEIKEKYKKQIQDSYLFFYNKLKSAHEKDYDSELEMLDYLKRLQVSVWSLQCIEILAENEIDAHEVFEKINASGKELNTADHIKNLIFKNLNDDQSIRLAQDFWQDIYDTVSPTSVDIKSFIRYHWLSKYSFKTDKELYKAVRGQFNNSKDYDKFISELRDSSHYFVDIIENGFFEDFANRKDFIYSHSIIKSIGVKQQNVLLLSLYRNSQKESTFKAILSNVYKIIEEFSFLYFTLSNLPAREVEKTYSEYAISFEAILKDYKLNQDNEKFEDDLNSETEKFKNELSGLLPKKVTLEESLSKDFVYKQSKKQISLIRYIFKRLEESLYTNDEEQKIDWEKIHIEHCMPRNPHDDWKISNKDENFLNHVNRLGNLTILSKKINARIKNFIITKKLPDYKKSKLYINKNFLINEIDKNGGNWDYLSIDKRSKLLSEKIIDTFKVFDLQ